MGIFKSMNLNHRLRGGGAEIKTFKEKPDHNTAVKYFSSPHYWWNSGMFAFNCDFFFLMN